MLQPGPRGRRPTAAPPLSLTRRGDQALPDLPLTLTLPIPAGFCGLGGLAGGTPYCERGAERRNQLTLPVLHCLHSGLCSVDLLPVCWISSFHLTVILPLVPPIGSGL